MLFGVEAMFYPASADVVLQVKNIIQSRHQVPDVFRRGPTFLVKLHDPVQHFGGAVHLAEREPVIVRPIIENGSAVPIELPFAPAFRKRLAEKPVQNFDDRTSDIHA